MKDISGDKGYEAIALSHSGVSEACFVNGWWNTIAYGP
jgi:hypothetical protein